MFLSAVQLAGVGPIRDSLKIPFSQGYCALWAPSGSGRTSLVRALLAVLDDEYAANAAASIRNRSPLTEQFRVLATFQNGDTQMRCIRDLNDGCGSTMVLDPIHGKVKDEGRLVILNGMIERFDFCLPEDWRRVFVWSPGVGGSRVVSTGASGAGQDFRGRDVASLQRELQDLQEEKMLLGSSATMQEQADTIQHILIEAEKRLEDIQRILAVHNDHVAFIEGKHSLTQAGPALMERARNYQELDSKFAKKSYTHQDKVAVYQAAIKKASASRRWFKDPLFPVTIAAFLGFLIAAGVTKMQILAVPSVLAMGAAGFLGWRYFMIGATIAEQEKELDDENRSFAREEAKHKEAVGKLFELQKEYRLLSPEDLIKVWDELEQRRAQLAGWLAANKLEQLRTEQEMILEELTHKRKKHEEMLLALSDASSSGSGDSRELDNRIAAVQRALKQAQEQGGVVSSTGTQAVAVGGGEEPALVDGAALMEAATRVGRSGEEEIREGLLGRVDRLLQHFFGTRFSHLLWEGEWILRPADDGRDEPAENLSHGEKIVLSGLIRIALWQTIATDRMFPIILDDPLASMDDDRARLMHKLLLKTAERSQVVHLTGRRLFVPAESIVLATGAMPGAAGG